MKYFISLIFFFLFINSASAQDSSGTCRNELKHGIQFQLRSLLDLTNFDGYTFSYRYRFNNNSGIRIGVYTSIDQEDYDITQQLNDITSNPPDYQHFYAYKLSGQYLFSLAKFKSFALIFGGGPFISYSKSESKYQNLATTYTRKYESKSESTGFGLDVIFGVEYQLVENIILSGEYGLSIYKENSDIDSSEKVIFEDESQNTTHREYGKRHSILTRRIGANLGISVFF